jgi:hypothetical protein
LAATLTHAGSVPAAVPPRQQVTLLSLLLQPECTPGWRGLPDLCSQAVNEGPAPGRRDSFYRALGVLLSVLILSFGGGVGIWRIGKLPFNSNVTSW